MVPGGEPPGEEPHLEPDTSAQQHHQASPPAEKQPGGIVGTAQAWDQPQQPPPLTEDEQRAETDIAEHQQQQEEQQQQEQQQEQEQEPEQQQPLQLGEEHAGETDGAEGHPQQHQSATVDEDRPPEEGFLHDPDLSSLSTMSHFSTGLSVDSDADSALGDVSTPMSTTSVRSSIYEFVEEHGRTFHRYKQGRYWMPNDMVEQDRLDLQHAVFSMLLKGKLGLAPVENPQSALDIGTGTGIWAIEFALQHPSADVLGTDLSPIQPDYVPANCHFEVDDAEDDWVYSRTFDYIHLRLMFHTFKSHRRLIESAFEHLAPGGWMEWQDYYCQLQCVDDTMRGTALERWVRLYIEGGGRMGRDMLAPRRYKSLMEEAGFVNVTEDRLAIPGNAWPRGREQKMLGLWQMTNFLDGIQAVSMTIFTKGLGMTREEVELLLVEVRKDIKNVGIHFYFLTYFVYGQKPSQARPNDE